MTHSPPPLVSRPPGRMPDQISVSEFITETTEDYNSPTTSSFTTRLHNCRNTVTLLEEVGRGRRAPPGPRPFRRDASMTPAGSRCLAVELSGFLSGEEREFGGWGSHTPSGIPPCPLPGEEGT